MIFNNDSVVFNRLYLNQGGSISGSDQTVRLFKSKAYGTTLCMIIMKLIFPRLSNRDEEVDLNDSRLTHHSSRAVPNDYGKEPTSNDH